MVSLGTISGWSVVDKGQECVYLAFLRWRVCVRTGDPKMSAPQVVPLRFGITSALPSIPWASNFSVSLGTTSSFKVVGKSQGCVWCSLVQGLRAHWWFQNECSPGSTTSFSYHQYLSQHPFKCAYKLETGTAINWSVIGTDVCIWGSSVKGLCAHWWSVGITRALSTSCGSMTCVFSNAPQQRTKFPRATLSTLFSCIGFPLMKGCGLRITPVYNTDADYQDYGLALRLAGFDVNRINLI